MEKGYKLRKKNKKEFKMVKKITTEVFKKLVYDFEKNPNEWKFEGAKPAIIDYFADWCQPCKMIAPILEELSEEYKDKVDIYKVNVDEEHELSAVFGIKSIPSILFVPMKNQPQMTTGGLPKESFKKAINEVLEIE